MSLFQWIAAAFFKALTGLMFRVDAAALAKVPRRGPLIIVTNHVHIPEIPTLYVRLLPRKVIGMAQAERVLDKNIVGGNPAVVRHHSGLAWRGRPECLAHGHPDIGRREHHPARPGRDAQP